MKHVVLKKLVQRAYDNSQLEWARWIWENHVPVVAEYAESVARKYGANVELCVAGALLHDFGDAFVDRHDPMHQAVTLHEARAILEESGYERAEQEQILTEILPRHNAKGEHLPVTLEDTVVASADALAHLNTDFYLQLCWLHIPQNKTFSEFTQWVNGKLDRDFNQKLFFEDEKNEVADRYHILKNTFQVTSHVRNI
jgi:putative nucleotidyltransferase with HDIG domain